MSNLKVKAKLPTNEEKVLTFPARTTVEQVKNKFFELVPPRYRKEPYFIQIGDVVLDLEFYKFQEAYPAAVQHAEAGTELDITFITQLDAKRKKDKGEVHTVAPHAKTVDKNFVEAQKIKERTGAVVSNEEAGELAKKRAEHEERLRKEEEDRKKRLAEEAELRKQEEERLKKEEEEKKKRAAEEAAKQEAIAAGWFEVQQRVETLRKQVADEKAEDDSQHAAKMSALNKEFDEKMAALEAEDKADLEAYTTKIAELKKIGVAA